MAKMKEFLAASQPEISGFNSVYFENWGWKKIKEPSVPICLH